MLLADAHRHFCYERQALGLAERTVEKYRYAFNRFQKHCPQAPETTGELDRETVLAFYVSLHNSSLKPNTVHTWAKDFRTFLVWARLRGWLDFDPPPAPGPPKTDRHNYSDQELQKLVTAASRGRNAARNRALLVCLLATGLRVGELCSLEIRDLDLPSGLIRIRGETSKSRESRLVPMGHLARLSLHEYLTFGRLSEEQRVFLGEDGRPLGVRGVQGVIKRLGRSAGVPWARPHLFRHAFAVRTLLGGASLVHLQALLGHSTIRSTEIYLHQAAVQQAATALQHTPADRVLRRR